MNVSLTWSRVPLHLVILVVSLLLKVSTRRSGYPQPTVYRDRGSPGNRYASRWTGQHPDDIESCGGGLGKAAWRQGGGYRHALPLAPLRSCSLMRPAQLANQNGLAWSGGKEPKRVITCGVYAKPPAALIGNSSLYYRTEQ